MQVERKTPAELTEIARDIVTNQVYAAWDAYTVNLSFGGFLMLAVGAAQEQGQDVSWIDDVGVVYEDLSKAGPMAVNGLPSFLSAKFVHVDDRITLHRECLRLSVALGSASQEVLDAFDNDVARHEARAHQQEEEPDA